MNSSAKATLYERGRRSVRLEIIFPLILSRRRSFMCSRPSICTRRLWDRSRYCRCTKRARPRLLGEKRGGYCDVYGDVYGIVYGVCMAAQYSVCATAILVIGHMQRHTHPN